MGNVKDNIVGGISSLGDKLSGGLSSLGGGISDVFNAIIDLPQKIIDLLKSALTELFVPDETPVEDIKKLFNEKYPIINQIGDIAIGLFDEFSDTDTPPQFTVSINGNTQNIINLDWYSNYKGIVKGILMTLAWIYFIQWLLRFIPKLLGGVT